MRAGLTVSASIPIAVLSISILRAFGKVSILENNIVQTTGSAGESIAGGVIFTLPALIFLGFPLEYWRVFFLALIGGWLGVLFMIPLRRQLIVKEHGNLLFPEGTACADVLVAGDKGGSFAGRVFWGLGLGGVYSLLHEHDRALARYADLRSQMAARRVVSREHHSGISRRRLHHRPAHRGHDFFGRRFFLARADAGDPIFRLAGAESALYPSTIPIPLMTSDQLWSSYIRPMGAGAVAAAGVITLAKTLPTIWSALPAGLKDVRAGRARRRWRPAGPNATCRSSLC